MYQQAKQARLPYETAGQSMLQSLPVLQRALGLPAYELTPGPGGRLQEYTGTYDVAASPLYQWQLGQMDERLKHQLNAMGLSGDPAAALIRSQNIGQLAAEERQRQIGDMMALIQQGSAIGANTGALDMAAGQALAGMEIGRGQDISGAISQAATNRGNILAGLGQNLGQTTLGIGSTLAQGQVAGGQNILNAGISKAAIPNPMNQLINTGLQLYGMGAFSPRPRSSAPNLGAIGTAQTMNTGLPFMYGLSNVGGF
jgi:hypothetical protein